MFKRVFNSREKSVDSLQFSDSDEDDHEEQRKKRRQSFIPNPHNKSISILDRSTTSIQNSSTRSNALLSFSNTSRLKNINYKDIEAHVSTCTKLYMENKINKVNAWGLRVIEMCSVLLTNKEVDNKEMLSTAGNSLDVGAKVYGYRVDDIHSKGMCLASNITDDANHNSSQIDGNENTDEMNGPNPKQRRKRQVKKLSQGSFFREFDDICDQFVAFNSNESVLQKEDIRVHSGQNYINYLQPLLINRFHADQESYDKTKVKFWTVSFEPDPTLSSIEDALSIPLPDETTDNLAFVFAEFDMRNSDAFFDQHNTSLAGDAAIIDDNGIPIAQIDASICNIFDTSAPPLTVSDDEYDLNDNPQYKLTGEIISIDGTIPANEMTETDYGFYDFQLNSDGRRRIGRIWAGPSHWKAPFVRRGETKFSGAAHKECAKKSARKNTKIDWDVEPDSTFDLGQRFEKVRNVPKTTIDKITLPAFSDVFSAEIRRLMLKPEVEFRDTLRESIKCKQEKELSIEVQDGDVSSENGGDFGTVMEENVDLQGNELLASEHLASLDEANAGCVPFALKAKSIDIKALKGLIFEAYETLTKKDESDVSFSVIYVELGGLLSEEKRNDLSPHLALTALLHLCNEERLRLHQNDNTDFTINKM